MRDIRFVLILCEAHFCALQPHSSVTLFLGRYIKNGANPDDTMLITKVTTERE